MDHKDGIQPESLRPGHNPPSSPSPPTDTLREGPPPLPSDVAALETETDPGFFTSTNIVMLGMLGALALYLLMKFNFEEMWNILKAVLGLSFVIFIHEMGHFLAAKWCKVNVTTFSIGFGPPIPGCSFTWGETTYKLAIIPLGGYVQMVGQIDGDEGSDGSDDDPGSYKNKSVGQRMLIISAGVIMNAILAVVCFIIVYMGPGKEHPAGNISHVDAGAPAAEHGVRTGSKITHFQGKDDPTFFDLMQIVINSLKDQKLKMSYQRSKDGEPIDTEIEALIPEETSDRPRRPMIGVGAPPRLQLASKRVARTGPFWAGTPAAEAKFENSDVIVAMTDPEHPDQIKDYKPTRIKDLPDDWRYPDHGQKDYFEFARRLQLLTTLAPDKEIVVVVQRGTDDEVKQVSLTIKPAYRIDLGARMEMGPVLSVRENSPAAGKVNPPAKSESTKLAGDKIEAVEVMDIGDKGLADKRLEFKGATLDPERLPMQLRQWSDRLDRANIKGDRFVTLHLRRHSKEGGAQFIPKEEKLKWDTGWRFDRVLPLSPNAPMAIPELGLAYEIQARVAGVKKGSPLQKDDVIKNIRYEIEGHEEQIPEMRAALYWLIPSVRPEPDTDVKAPWLKEDLKEGQWAYISHNVLQSSAKFKRMFVKVERNKKPVEVEIPVAADETWPLPERGWYLASDTRRVKASDPVSAVWMGFADTTSRMMEVFQNLRGMILGRISVWNLGGPLTIARATYLFAGMDFGEFVFFLGLISINLAVVNFLPIPVLDGGHMVFLIYEKIAGRPANENVRIWATYAGLAIIACLMLFVLYLDVTRLFF